MRASLGILLNLLAGACVQASAQEPPSLDVRAAYEERIAAEDVQAAGSSVSTRTLMMQAATSGECAENDVLWHRDIGVDICATPCRDDADCFQQDRCAALDFGPPVDGVSVPFADYETASGAAALGLCDPFWPTNPNVDGMPTRDL